MQLSNSKEIPEFIELCASKSAIRLVYFFTGFMAFITLALAIAAIVAGFGFIDTLNNAEKIAYFSLVSILCVSCLIFITLFRKHYKQYKEPLFISLDQKGIQDFRNNMFVSWGSVKHVELIEAKKIFTMPQTGFIYDFEVPLHIEFLEKGKFKRIVFPWTKAVIYNPKTIDFIKLQIENSGNYSAKF